MATNFESHTHQQLLAMLASANAETLKARGAQLTDAAATIKEIGESLKDHRVTGWEGESATAFQDWVSRAGNATLRLSEYSAEGGKQLTQASQVVIEVKANMPTYDSGAAANLEASREYRNDPDAAQIGQQAHSKLSGDRQQAIQQMTKLAQGYEASATGMEMAEIPTFPKWPDPFVPPHVDGAETMARSGGTSGAGDSSCARDGQVQRFIVGLCPAFRGASRAGWHIDWGTGPRTRHGTGSRSGAPGPQHRHRSR